MARGGVGRRGDAAVAQQFKTEPGPVTEHAVRSDHLRRRVIRHRHHIPVTGHETRHEFRRRHGRELRHLGLGQCRHRADTVRQCSAGLAVIKDTIVAQDEAMRAGLLDDLRRPDNPAARVIAAKNRHDHAVVGADILEPPEDAGRDVDDVALLENNLAVIARRPPEEAPTPGQDEEHLGRPVGVKRVAAFRRLPGGTDVESRGIGDVDMLVGGFRNAAADDGEILLAVAAGRVRVDKGGATWHQITIPDNTLVQINRVHFPTPFSSGSASRSRFHQTAHIPGAGRGARTRHGWPP